MSFHKLSHNLNILLSGFILRFSLILFPRLILIQFFSGLVRIGLVAIVLELTLFSVALSGLHVQCPKL